MIRISEFELEEMAIVEFGKTEKEGLFPNHSDRDIWIKGFIASQKLKPHLMDKLKTANLRLLLNGNPLNEIKLFEANREYKAILQSLYKLENKT